MNGYFSIKIELRDYRSRKNFIKKKWNYGDYTLLNIDKKEMRYSAKRTCIMNVSKPQLNFNG